MKTNEILHEMSHQKENRLVLLDRKPFLPFPPKEMERISSTVHCFFFDYLL